MENRSSITRHSGRPLNSAECFSELVKELVDKRLRYFKPKTFGLKIIRYKNKKGEKDYKFDLYEANEELLNARSSLCYHAALKEPNEDLQKGELLKEPGVYFVFAHYMDLPPIPLYVGKTVNIHQRLTYKHDFGKHFINSCLYNTALSRVRKGEDLDLSLSLTVAYTKNEVFLADYLGGLFLQLFDFAFNERGNRSYRFDKVNFHEMMEEHRVQTFCELLMMELKSYCSYSITPNAASVKIQDQSAKLDEVNKKLISFPFNLNLIKFFHFSLKGPSRKLLDTLRSC